MVVFWLTLGVIVGVGIVADAHRALTVLACLILAAPCVRGVVNLTRFLWRSASDD